MKRPSSRSAYVIVRTCVAKKSYSKQAADDYITEAAKQGKVLYYYKCQFCSRYHLSKHDHTVNSVDIIGG